MSGVLMDGVIRRYGAVRAVDEITLEVAPGELVALLGPSGCGKTTLLRLIAGLEKPDHGRVVIGGRDVTRLGPRDRPIGVVFQSYALFPNMTVRQNIAFPLVVRRRGKAEIRKRVDEMLELVQLEKEADRYPNQVSGGQQQRTALARAVAPAPEVLLLDEPLSALDALVRQRLRDDIRRIQQAVKTTAVYVTHDQSEAMAIADRVAVMRTGRIEQIEAPAALYDAPATKFAATFVGSRNALALPVLDGAVGLGAAFRLAAPAGSNGKALVFFRPEDVLISRDGAGEPAHLEVKLFLGPTTRLHLATRACGGARFFADLPSRQAAEFQEGDLVKVAVEPGNVLAFAGDEVYA